MKNIRFPRLRFGLGLCFVPAVLLLTAQAQDAKAPTEPAPPALDEIKITERVNAATTRALDYIASKQRPDGGWANNNAINGFTLLAFLGRGHTPGRGPYKEVLEKGKKFLLSTQQPTGYTSFSSMYEHGMATLAMAEMYGMDPDPELEEKTRKAVDLIVKIQGNLGGWNYAPSPADGDLSVSVMQIVAMRAASNAEVPVPQTAIKKAITYVRGKANPSGPGYGYAGPGPGTPQTSAAGALSMQLLGQYNDPQIERTLAWLSAIKPDWSGAGGVSYFYYFHYYAIQAYYQAGGKEWNEWHPRVRELLLKNQNKDGSWDVPPGSAEANLVTPESKVYSTAIATLVLNIYKHFLPAYQR